MDRRRFLGLFGAGIAGIALEQAIPLGRVWSFPKEIVIAPATGNLFLDTEWVTLETLRILKNNLSFDDIFDVRFERKFRVGEVIRAKLPQRFIIKDDFYDFRRPSMTRNVVIVDEPGDLTAAFRPDDFPLPS